MSSDSVPDARDKAAARLRMALELFETGVEMMREKLSRDHPGLADHEIAARLRAGCGSGPVLSSATP
jgi:hypothetical protein